MTMRNAHYDESATIHTLPPKVKGQQIGTISFQLKNVSIFQNNTNTNTFNMIHGENKDRIHGNTEKKETTTRRNHHHMNMSKMEDQRNIYCQFQFWGDESIFEIQNHASSCVVECDDNNNNNPNTSTFCKRSKVALSSDTLSSRSKKTFPIVGSILSLKHYFKDIKTLQLLILHKKTRETLTWMRNEVEKEDTINDSWTSTVSVLGYSSLNLNDVLKLLMHRLEGVYSKYCSESSCCEEYIESQLHLNTAITSTSSSSNSNHNDSSSSSESGHEREFKKDSDEIHESTTSLGETELIITLRIDLKNQQKSQCMDKYDHYHSMKEEQVSIKKHCSGRTHTSTTPIVNDTLPVKKKRSFTSSPHMNKISFNCNEIDLLQMSPTWSEDNDDIEDDSILLNAMFQINVSENSTFGSSSIQRQNSIIGSEGKDLLSKDLSSDSRNYNHNDLQKNHANSLLQKGRKMQSRISVTQLTNKSGTMAKAPNNQLPIKNSEQSNHTNLNSSTSSITQESETNRNCGSNKVEGLELLDSTTKHHETNEISIVQSNAKLDKKFELQSKKVIDDQLWVRLELSRLNLSCSMINSSNTCSSSLCRGIRIRIRASCSIRSDIKLGKEFAYNRHSAQKTAKSSSSLIFKESIYNVICNANDTAVATEIGIILGDNETFSWDVPLHMSDHDSDSNGKYNDNSSSPAGEIKIECWICSSDGSKGQILDEHIDTQEMNILCPTSTEEYIGTARIPFLTKDWHLQTSPFHISPFIEINDRINFLLSGKNDCNVSAAACVCIAPLRKMNLLHKVRNAVSCIQKWWSYTRCQRLIPQHESSFLNSKQKVTHDKETKKKEEENSPNERHNKQDNKAHKMQKILQKKRNVETISKISEACNTKIDRVPVSSQRKKELLFFSSPGNINVVTDNCTAPEEDAETKNSSLNVLDEEGSTDKKNQEVRIKVGKVKGIKEIIILWLENENLLEQQSNDVNDLFYSAGILVTFEIMSKELSNYSNCYSKQYCSSRILNLENLVSEDDDFDLTTTIKFDSSKQMLNYVMSETLTLNLWFLPIVTEAMHSQYPTINMSKCILPDGSKKVCWSNCPLRAILSIASETRFCCPWIVPLTKGSEDTEMMGEVCIIFEAFGKARGNDSISVNLCTYDVEECSLNKHICDMYESNFNELSPKISLEDEEGRTSKLKDDDVVNSDRDLKRNAILWSKDISLQPVTLHEDVLPCSHPSVDDAPPCNHICSTPDPLSKSEEISLKRGKNNYEEGEDLDNNPNSDFCDTMSYRNLSTVLSSLDIITAKVKDTFQERNKNEALLESGEVSLESSDNPSALCLKTELSGKKRINDRMSRDKESKSMSPLQKENLFKEAKSPSLSTVLSNLENVYVDLGKIGQIEQRVNKSTTQKLGEGKDDYDDNIRGTNDIVTDSVSTNIDTNESSTQPHINTLLEESKEKCDWTHQDNHSFRYFCTSSTSPDSSHHCFTINETKMKTKDDDAIIIDKSFDERSTSTDFSLKNFYMDGENESETSSTSSSTTTIIGQIPHLSSRSLDDDEEKEVVDYHENHHDHEQKLIYSSSDDESSTTSRLFTARKKRNVHDNPHQREIEDSSSSRESFDDIETHLSGDGGSSLLRIGGGRRVAKIMGLWEEKHDDVSLSSSGLDSDTCASVTTSLTS